MHTTRRIFAGGVRVAAAAAVLLTVVPGPVGRAGADGVGVITTIAGGRTATVPGGGYATLSAPRTAAVDVRGDIYFTDTYHHQIRRLDRSGVVTTIAGNGYRGSGGDGGPATEASLDTPHGVAVDNRGHVYIADSPNHRIRVVDLAAGTIRTVAGTGSEGYSGDGGPAAQARLNRPRFLLVAGDGSLIVADTGNYRVRRVDPAGIITTIAGTGERGYSGDGGPATAARLDDPRGLAFDDAGNLYVSNAEGSERPTVRRIDRAGTISTVAGGQAAGFGGDGGPATAARLDEPRSIAVRQSTLYIADSMNDRVRAVDLGSGIIRTVAGTGSASFGGDGGPAARARINEPRGIALTPAGDLVIVDTNNDRLRFVDLDGSGLPPGSGDGSGSDQGAPGSGSDGGIGPLSAASRSGSGGYRLVASDGGVFSFGDAGFFGSTGGLRLARPIVGMASTPSGRGYWLVASDGGIFSFGDARFFGSTGDVPLTRPVVGMAPAPSGRGYWLLASDGGVFSFGEARFFGSAAARTAERPAPAVSLAPSPTGQGYRIATTDGTVLVYGDAAHLGSTTGTALAFPIVGLAH
ncbi:MAG TPA: hypothetical protein VFS16_10840 [Acidimicrobiia bacterium]|nr:hypothetical protein [Acidimicrobiia bacterium]